MHPIRLSPVDLESRSECSELVEFVNRYYPSEIPLDAASVASGKTTFFWAQEADQKERIGVTGFMTKTRYLAETVKTVVASSHRGRGLGVALSQAIEDEVRRRGFKKVMTTIYITNLPMIFIKLKQGYLFEGFHPDHEKPGLHEYSLGKVFK